MPRGTFGSVRRGDKFFAPFRSAADLATETELALGVMDGGKSEPIMSTTYSNGKSTYTQGQAERNNKQQKKTTLPTHFVVTVTSSAAIMKDPAEVDAVVLQYLRKKGYMQAEGTIF